MQSWGCEEWKCDNLRRNCRESLVCLNWGVLGSLCFNGCTLQEEGCEWISMIWIKGCAGKGESGYAWRVIPLILFICKDLRGKPPRVVVFSLVGLPFCFVIHTIIYIITPFIFIIFPSQLSHYDISYFILYIFSSL